MKKKLKWLLILGVMVLTSTIKSYASEPYNLKQMDYLDKYEVIYQNMVDKIKYTTKTGDSNLDFLFYMLPYEQFGAEFSKTELCYGNDPMIKDVVSEILKTNQDHIKGIDQLLKAVEDSPVVDEAKEASYLEQFNQIYNEMLLSLQMNTENRLESIDDDYLQKMVIYLDYQKKFINLILANSNHEDVIKLAQKMISNNEYNLEKISEINSQKNK